MWSELDPFIWLLTVNPGGTRRSERAAMALEHRALLAALASGDTEDAEPRRRRGYSPQDAERYWGIGGDEYYERADVWPLDSRGELLPILQCETVSGVENLPALCREVPKPDLILISTGGLSASLGLRGAHTPEVEALVQRAAGVCRAHAVPFGTPHGMPENIEARVEDGFRLLMCGPRRDVSTLLKGRAKAGR